VTVRRAQRDKTSRRPGGGSVVSDIANVTDPTDIPI
jgi:hypothetical protein